jgi:uncharacterized protein YraI
MLAKNAPVLLSVIFIYLSALACNMPGGTPDIEVPPPTNTVTYTVTAAEVASETPSPIATVEACKPIVTTNTNANVRSGPGQAYAILGSIPQGGSASVAGKNYDGTWWYIEFAGGAAGFAWIAGSVTSADCIPDTLASIVAPPTAVIPTAAPTNTSMATAAPSATATSGGGIIIPPPIFIFPTATPTFLFIFPIFTFGP